MRMELFWGLVMRYQNPALSAPPKPLTCQREAMIDRQSIRFRIAIIVSLAFAMMPISVLAGWVS